MSVKALKRQLMAAIAMALVAALALSGSTFAWFVSNNNVTARTNSISAQSNSANLKIEAGSDKTITDKSTGIAQSETLQTDKYLYPVQVTFENNDEFWRSAYAGDKASATISGNKFLVGTAGKHKDALDKSFTLKESFTIGTDTATNGSFTNLKVSGVSATTSAESNDLVSAMRVLVVCGQNHYVYNAQGSLISTYEDTTSIGNTNNSDGVLAATIGAKGTSNVTVDLYLFYDGSHAKIFTDNLVNMSEVGLTVTFTATPVDASSTTT